MNIKINRHVCGGWVIRKAPKFGMPLCERNCEGGCITKSVLCVISKFNPDTVTRNLLCMTPCMKSTIYSNRKSVFKDRYLCFI